MEHVDDHIVPSERKQMARNQNRRKGQNEPNYGHYFVNGKHYQNATWPVFLQHKALPYNPEVPEIFPPMGRLSVFRPSISPSLPAYEYVQHLVLGACLPSRCDRESTGF